VNQRAEPPSQKRLQILDVDELEALYGRPRLTPEERLQYFTLTPAEHDARALLRSVPSQLYFMLQLAYFKAKQLFFTFTFAEVADDVAYLLAHAGFAAPAPSFAPLNKRTILHHRQLILDLFRYRLCAAPERQQLVARAQQAARMSSKPIYVFRELLQFLIEQRIVLPGYTVLQELAGKALMEEQQRLINLMQTHLAPHECTAFDTLFADTDGLYTLTRLKHEPKDFSLGEMRQEIRRGDQLRPLYQLAKRIVPELEISNEGIKYYASLVGYYSVFRLRQLDPWLVYLYLLCFVTHRYQQCHDHLLSCFIHTVTQSIEDAKAAAKEQIATQRMERNADLPKVGQILKLFTSDQIAATTPFQTVRSAAFAILDRHKLDDLADYISTKVHVDELALHWAHVEGQAKRLKRHLRPILMAMDVNATRADAPLLEAVQFLKTTFAKGRSLGQAAPDSFPTQFMPVRLKRYLYALDESGQKRLIGDRYEVLVYRQLRNALESGDLFCRDSVRFRSFEDDLISDQDWQDKERVIAQSGLLILLQPIQDHLAALERQLEARIVAVNQRIAAGENPHFKIKRRGERTRWTLQYPGGSESVNHPVFDTLRPVDVGSLLHFVNQTCPFMACFEHVLGRYVNQVVDERVIRACLVAWGTNMGLGRMGEISDIPYQTLARASENFLRLETLHAANDCVSNAIAALPIFRYYDLGEVIHSSSDGQKFETRLHTINARHSPKYFGLQKGVVGYTLVANHIPVNARIIGAHEHESHFVFDLLFNNTTDIQPNVHSTDTHGTNEVNFVLLHMFNYQFAPRYKALQEKVRTSLYGFHHRSQYGDLILKPIRKIQTELIVEEWDNLQRIFVSLARKTTTQSIIVGKLSAYARKNKTRQALWEYDNIMRSLYLLEYIDSPPLRQNVQRALNRGENYHQLRRAVSYANFGKLRLKSEDEQQLWNECCRLITNCIIYYNAMILSRLLAHKEAAGDGAGATLLTQVSPIAWQHINFYGRYEFTKGPTPINLDAIVEELAQRPIVPTPEES
jgi:TnpA family transposase